MKLRHIEIFHTVYLSGSVSAAARILSVSQPSVTKVLRHAEQQIGFPLFVRTRGRLVPTEEAHLLFQEVSDIQDRVYALRQSSQNLRKGRGAVIRVAALPSLGLGAIPDAVARFLKRRPSVVFDLQTTHHDEMVRRLYERETDIVVGFDVPRNAAMAHRRLGQSELVVMFDERALPDPGESVALPELAGKPFISPVQSGPIGHLLSAELGRLEVELDEVVSARTFYIAAALVRAGVGMTVVDRFTAQATAGPGVGFRSIEPPLTFDVYAAYLESRPPSALAGLFLDDLAAVIGCARDR